MYKVFFNDRTVYFGDNFSRAFERNRGLFYRYGDFYELKELLGLFDSLTTIHSLYLLHDDMLHLIKEFQACFDMVYAGGGLVFNKQGQFLTIQRNGKWDLPKGKLEGQEDFERAALREVKEETGLKDLQLVDPLISTYHTYRLEGKMILKKTRWFEMVYPGDELPVLQESEGITDYRWVAPGDTGFIRNNTYASILDVLYIREVL